MIENFTCAMVNFSLALIPGNPIALINMVIGTACLIAFGAIATVEIVKIDREMRKYL